MSFRPAGFRPAAFGAGIALLFVLYTGAAVAQKATPAVTTSTPQPTDIGLPATAVPATATSAKPGSPEAAIEPQVVKAGPGDASAGQTKATVCGACHGMDGNSSDPQYPKLAGQHGTYIARQLTLFKSAKRQNPIMMGMAAPLSEQDMRDLGAYFATKQSLPGVADTALVELGQKLFREGDADRGVPACMACHSIDGRGNPGAMYPQLSGQHAQYIQKTLTAWHDGTTWGDDAQAKIMPAIAQKLSSADIAALASYIEGLHRANTAEGAGAP